MWAAYAAAASLKRRRRGSRARRSPGPSRSVWLRSAHRFGRSIPPLYFGLGYTRYAKPYQVTVGDAVFDEAVFDARFEGLGLANYVLNDDLPENWAIGYAQGNVAVGYIHPVLITMPTPLVGLEASAGGATFFYFKTVRQEGEPLETPPLNWDLLWAVRAYFTLPL